MSSKWPNNYTILTSQLLTKPSNLSRISHTAPPGVRDRHRYYEHWHAHGRRSQRLSRRNTRQRQQQQRRKHDRRRAPASQPKIQAKRQKTCTRVLPTEQRSPQWWTTTPSHAKTKLAVIEHSSNNIHQYRTKIEHSNVIHYLKMMRSQNTNKNATQM